MAAEGLAVAVVHTDDLVAGWDDQFGFRDRLDRWVLEPLLAGRPARYRVYDWVRGEFGAERILPVPEVLIVEGSTTTGAAPRAELTLSVLLDAPQDQRLARALARDGAGIEAPLRRWMAAEQAWFARERPAEWVDHRIDAATASGAPSRESVQHLGPGDCHG